jgi:hypothetical protein
MQVMARKALVKGLADTIAAKAIAGRSTRSTSRQSGAKRSPRLMRSATSSLGKMAVVLRVEDNAATIGLRPVVLPNRQVASERETGVNPAQESDLGKMGGRRAQGPQDPQCRRRSEPRRRHLCCA